MTGSAAPLYGQDSLETEDNTIFATYGPNSTYSSPSSTGCTPAYESFNFDSTFGTTNDLSSKTSAVSTPDFTGFSFEQAHTPIPQPSTFPSTPTLGTPHPYPIQFQQHQHQRHQHQPQHQHFDQFERVPLHGLPIHSRINQPFHRRSLSQGNAERITAANPHFYRVAQTSRPQVRRAISAAPEDNNNNSSSSKRNPAARLSPYNRTPRQNNGQGNRSMNMMMRGHMPTSAPGAPHGSMVHQQQPGPGFSRGWTEIGMPLGRNGVRGQTLPLGGGQEQEMTTYESEGRSGKGIKIQLTGPRFTFMSHEEQMRDSSRVIEIGTMAVVAQCACKQGVLVQHGEEDVVKSSCEVLKMVEQMEKQLKLQDLGDERKEKGIRGCDMIREGCGMIKEVLVEKAAADESMGKPDDRKGTGDDVDQNHTYADSPGTPSGLCTETEPMCMGTSDDDLFTLLKNDLEANGFEAD